MIATLSTKYFHLRIYVETNTVYVKRQIKELMNWWKHEPEKYFSFWNRKKMLKFKFDTNQSSLNWPAKGTYYFKKSKNKETKPPTSIQARMVSEVFCKTGKQFHSQVPEGSQKKTGDSIYKSKKRTIAILPLAMKDINENKSRMRTAAFKHSSIFYGWHVKCFIKLPLPCKASRWQRSTPVKCQGTK